MEISKYQVEKLLGFEITEKQFRQSEEQAKKKLASIIKKFGDGNGSRLRLGYLLELVREEVVSSNFSKITVFAAGNVLNMEKEHLANC